MKVFLASRSCHCKAPSWCQLLWNKMSLQAYGKEGRAHLRSLVKEEPCPMARKFFHQQSLVPFCCSWLSENLEAINNHQDLQ